MLNVNYTKMEDFEMKVSDLVDKFENEQLIRVMSEEEVLFEGKADALKKITTHDVFGLSGTISDNGTIQIKVFR